jgi:hypothetical protein
MDKLRVKFISVCNISVISVINKIAAFAWYAVHGSDFYSQSTPINHETAPFFSFLLAL